MTLPPNWTAAPVLSICTARMGPTILAKDLNATGLPVFSAGGSGAPWGYTEMPVDRFGPGTIILSARGSIGNPRLPTLSAFTSTQTTIAATCAVGIEPRYLTYAFQRLPWQEIASGAAIPMLTISRLAEQSVPLAPIAEQIRIADKLDAILTRVDAVNTRLARVAPILKRFRQSVLAAATSGRLTEDWRLSANLDNKWQVTDVQSVAHVGTGSTPLRSNTEFFAATGTPWITSAATSQEVVNVATEYVTQTAITAHRLKVYPVGTLLVAMYGEGKTRGQVTELGIPATINQACAAVVVDESKMLKAFVKLALQANYLEMRVLAEGGNQPNLNLSKVKGFPLPFPCFDEQAEIVRRVETLFAFADRLEARLQVAQTATDRLTPSLLAKAFRGELVPQDPNDEPASELLKRLAATPATLTSKRRSKTTS